MKTIVFPPSTRTAHVAFRLSADWARWYTPTIEDNGGRRALRIAEAK